MKFVQIIEFQSSKIDEIIELGDEWAAKTGGAKTATREILGGDRDKPGTYLMMIEFPSYEAAMKNNDLPETAQIAEAMAKLSDGPPIFRNLDVLREETY
jgi:quinol monooxygenase YgiN